MKEYHNHLVSNIPNNFLTRWVVHRIVKRMTKSNSGHTLSIRYRKPKKGHSYSWSGNVRRDQAKKFSLYLVKREGFQKQLDGERLERLDGLKRVK